MKDYYDLWVLAQAFDFDGELLKTAIQATFNRRKTALPTSVPVGLTNDFSEDKEKQIQWIAFVRRTQFKTLAETDLKAVVAGIRDFLVPPTMAVRGVTAFSMRWPNKGPWQKSR